MGGSVLTEGTILLAAGLGCVMLFRRFGLGAVLGYLVAGALIGPSGLGVVGGGESKLAIAELGIALLLFLVGLELNPARLWRLKRDIFGLGTTVEHALVKRLQEGNQASQQRKQKPHVAIRLDECCSIVLTAV